MDALVRAAQAARLLDDDVLREAFDGIRDEYTAALVATPEAASDQRESLYRNIKAIERVRAKLQTYVDDGKFIAAREQRANPGA